MLKSLQLLFEIPWLYVKNWLYSRSPEIITFTPLDFPISNLPLSVHVKVINAIYLEINGIKYKANTPIVKLTESFQNQPIKLKVYGYNKTIILSLNLNSVEVDVKGQPIIARRSFKKLENKIPNSRLITNSSKISKRLTNVKLSSSALSIKKDTPKLKIPSMVFQDNQDEYYKIIKQSNYEKQ